MAHTFVVAVLTICMNVFIQRVIKFLIHQRDACR